MIAAPAISEDMRRLAGLLRSWDGSQYTDPSLADADWERLLDLARRHRVLPGLAASVTGADIVLPASVRATLQASMRQAAFEELALAATTRQLVRRLASAGIEVAVLKGVPLSLMIHGRLGVRFSRDIDLFVAPDVADAAVEILKGAGFRVVPSAGAGSPFGSKDIELVNDQTRQIVELHLRLFDNPHLMPDVTAAAFQRLALPHGLECHVLQDRINILYLANHGAQHGWSRLKWIVDLAALFHAVEGEGREQFYSGLSVADGRRAVGQALLLCGDLFDMPLPSTLVKDRSRDWRLRWMHAIALRTMTGSADREIEDMPFGSTAKNASHYLLRSDLPYLVAEMRHDLSPTRPDGANRFAFPGIIGRLASWFGRHRRLGR